jgi:hypothetical protein
LGLRGKFSGRLRHALNHSEETFGLQRLGQVIVHSSVQAKLAVAGHRVGRQSNDRYMPVGGLLTLANQRRRLQTALHRHLHVHQNGVERLFFQRFDGSSTVWSHGHACPRLSSSRVASS